jgi:CheY-like chemotaxis protein
VEDDLIVATDLQTSLCEMGYDAFAIASSAAEAMARTAERRPDIVLMDIRIKGAHDGIHTAAMLQSLHGVAIIYLTAHADEGLIERAKRTEPYGYILKPVRLPEVRGMIEITRYKVALVNAREDAAALEVQNRTLLEYGRLTEVARREAQLALLASDDKFRAVVGVIHDYAIFMLDAEGRVASWNSGAERLKGYRAEEIIGRHFSVFYSAEDVAAGKPERALAIAAAVGLPGDNYPGRPAHWITGNVTHEFPLPHE